MRPVCSECNSKPCAVNYHREGVTYYRKICDSCDRKKKKLKTPKQPRWYLAGYRMKANCENCNFKPKMPEQMTVYYIDGNREHISSRNLVTLCLNCNVEVSRTGWQRGDLLEDL